MKANIVVAGLLLCACGKSNDATPAAGSAAAPPAPAPAAAPPAPPPAPAPDVQACALISAADIQAIYGKPVVATGTGLQCSYGMDPKEKDKQLDALKNGGMASMMKKGGGIAIPTAISEQLVVEVTIDHDTQTEDQIKAIYGNIGKTVNDTVKPAEHGLDKAIQIAKELPNVGDWAFTTNIAAVNMGAGMSTRGRILEARQGTWRLSVSATIAPDPGEAKMDGELGDTAKAVLAKLK